MVHKLLAIPKGKELEIVKKKEYHTDGKPEVNEVECGLLPVDGPIKVDSEDGNRSKRNQWDKQIEFVLSCIGYSVGFGNFWRFPYLCLIQGGGAFIIAYSIFLAIVGIPLFFMELGLGQYAGLTVLFSFDVAPLFRGIGWAMLCISGFVVILYNLIMSWSMFYFGMSFQWNVPWRSCNNTWNTDECFSVYDANNLNQNLTGNDLHSSVDEFWRIKLLQISSGINEIGSFNWPLVACNFIAWSMTFLCLIKGIRSSGKVSYITATFPYLFLTIILVRGATLPGAMIGVNFYLSTDWDKLAEFKTWYLAAQQIFYSLGPAWGGLITMSSYNKRTNNILRDAVLLPIVCCFTSFYAGFAIFTVLGHVMHVTGRDKIESDELQGPSLAFVVYPEALAQLPGSAVWSVFFFATLLTLGLNSIFTTLETVTSGLIETFPAFLGHHKTSFTGTVCLIGFFLSLPLLTQAGFHIFCILDWYVAPIVAMSIGLLEAVAIAYVFGVRKFLANVECLVGKLRTATKVYWGFLLCVAVPSSCFLMLILVFATFKPPLMENNESYPEWTEYFGWSCAVLFFLPIPSVALAEIIKKRNNLRLLIQPSELWLDAVKKRFATH